MADFSLTTLFVVPVGETIPSSGSKSTQDLDAGEVGFFGTDYVAVDNTNIAAESYFYVAQGRNNTYMLGSKRSDRIKGCATANCRSNITEAYKVCGCGTPVNQILQIGDWNVKCGEIVTITLRAHSSYLDTLYFNGLTRSVTVQAPCCDCDGDPCDPVDCSGLLDLIISKLTGYTTTSGVTDWDSPISEVSLGINPDNFNLNTFFTFSKVTVAEDTCVLQIEGKPLTAYGVPCDVAAFPFEYDRMWFRGWAYTGPATTVDFIVADACNIIATSTTVQNSVYATGTSAEIKQLEKNYYSYQAGLLKHLYRQMGWNQNFDSWVTDGTVYDTYYIKFNNIDKSAYSWGDYIPDDSMVIIAVEKVSAANTAIGLALTAAIGTLTCDNECITTTSTTTVAPTTTTTTTEGQG